jgi:hypothetical protein
VIGDDPYEYRPEPTKPYLSWADRVWYRTGHRLELVLWEYLTPEARWRHVELDLRVMTAAMYGVTLAARELGVSMAALARRLAEFARATGVSFAEASERMAQAVKGLQP